MTDKIAVLTTCETEEEAHRLARALVEARLAACVNILPGMASVYRWKDQVEEAREVLLVVKTSRGLFDQVRQEIERIHSYELPEVIAVPIVAGSDAYLEWLAMAVKEEDSAAR